MFARKVLKFAVIGGVVLGSTTAIYITLTGEWDETFRNVKRKIYTKPLKKGEKPKVVVLGSGWGALSFIQQLDEDSVDLTVISPRSFFFYTPLLASMSTGTVSHSSITEPVRWHCSRFKDAKYIQAECTAVDIKKQSVKCNGHDNIHMNIPYDHLIVAIGAEPATFNIPGVLEHASFMKEVEDGLKVQRQLLQKLENASSLVAIGASEEEIKKELHWVVIGGGPTGVELCAEIGDFINTDIARFFPQLKDYIQVTLIEATDKILGVFDPKVSSYANKVLISHGTKVLCNTMVTQVSENSVSYKEKQGKGEMKEGTIDYGVLVWAGGINARPLTRSIRDSIGSPAVQTSSRGLVVDTKLRVCGLDTTSNSTDPSVLRNSVWALGDCAISGCAPTAQAAHQQGQYLGKLYRDTLFREENLTYAPDFTYINRGSLAYLGHSAGVAELNTNSLWDHYPAQNGKITVEGAGAFALWRSLYFSQLMSMRNRAEVGFDWIRTASMGRDISTPYILKNDNKEKINNSTNTTAVRTTGTDKRL